MKTFRIIATVAALALLSVSGIQAQPKDKCNWQEKMMSEKIAFITTELDITPEEAQVFWPVYNQIAKEKMELHKNMVESYRALQKALDEDHASDGDVDKLLKAYLEAQKACRESDNEDAEKFRKVLPDRKVAKLYVAEEKFRRQHIRNMKNGPHGERQEGSQAKR